MRLASGKSVLYLITMSLKSYIFHTLEFNHKSTLTVVINTLIILLILLSVPIDVLESVSDIPFEIKHWVFKADLTISWVFALEYALRVISCTTDPRYARPIVGRLKYMCTPLMVIDLLAISPFYIFGLGPLRILRIFRIFMLMRYTNAIQLLNRVVSEKKKELAVCMAFILMLWIWSSFMIFRVEHSAQPGVFRNMLDAFWWSAITFTTLGYGDIYPITLFGRIIAITTAILGLILFAITTAVLTAGIIQELKQWDEEGKQEPPV